MNSQVKLTGSKSQPQTARVINITGISQESPVSRQDCRYKLALPLENGIRFLNPRNIAFCQAQGNYTNIVLQNGDSILISKTLKWLESRLSSRDFFRTHGSFIVALDSIIFLGRQSAELDNGCEVAVSRRKRDDLLTKLQAISLVPQGPRP